MDPATALAGLPEGLRSELLDSLSQIVRNFRESRWEPSELNGGKLCEIVYSILKGHVDGRMPSRASKPRNMADACRALESADAARFTRSIRIQIPRMLIALYEVRNNRGVGHVGGDVDPNHMDAKLVLDVAKWIVAELVRVFHGLSIQEATQVVEMLVEKTSQTVWQVGDMHRVLKPDLSKKDQTLLLLYSAGRSVKASDLASWVESSNGSAYKRDVLRRAHAARLIEFNERLGIVTLSPMGVAYVEEHLPLDRG